MHLPYIDAKTTIIYTKMNIIPQFTIHYFLFWITLCVVDSFQAETHLMMYISLLTITTKQYTTTLCLYHSFTKLYSRPPTVPIIRGVEEGGWGHYSQLYSELFLVSFFPFYYVYLFAFWLINKNNDNILPHHFC